MKTKKQSRCILCNKEFSGNSKPKYLFDDRLGWLGMCHSSCHPDSYTAYGLESNLQLARYKTYLHSLPVNSYPTLLQDGWLLCLESCE